MGGPPQDQPTLNSRECYIEGSTTRISRIFPSNFFYCEFSDVIYSEHNDFLTLDKSPSSIFQPGRTMLLIAVYGSLRVDVKPTQSS